jgi:hypothetical protein
MAKRIITVTKRILQKASFRTTSTIYTFCLQGVIPTKEQLRTMEERQTQKIT